MTSAATQAVDTQVPARRRRHARPPVTTRSAVQLLIGVLILLFVGVYGREQRVRDRV